MISNGQLRHKATMDERRRLTIAIDTQIELLWERIRLTESDTMKSTWTIAILELKEVQAICNYPINSSTVVSA